MWTVELAFHIKLQANFSQVQIWHNVQKKTRTLNVQRLQPWGYLFGRSDWCYPIGHVKDVPFLHVHFMALHCFQVTDPQKLSHACKIEFQILCFGGKAVLNKKFSKFFYKTIQDLLNLCSFVKIGKTAVTKHGTSGQKSFGPFLWGLWSDLAKSFIGSLLPLHQSAKYHLNAASFRRDKCKNGFQTQH